MSGEQYASVINAHRRPYVYQIEHRTGGTVLIFGAEHSKDPSSPQFVEIRERWNQFRPTIALCESTLGILFPHFMDPVREFGEPGFVHALARESDLPTFTWEPENGSLVTQLLAVHDKQRVAARLILGPYFSNLRHGRPADPAGFVDEYRRKRTAWTSLKGTFSTMAELDKFWRGEFPNGPDWRDVSDQFGLPGFLKDIDLNTPRDEHFAAVVVDLVSKGGRVFAICGSSHAVKLEEALKATLASP